jgi:hypothetical protein
VTPEYRKRFVREDTDHYGTWCPVSHHPYSPRSPRFCDPWTDNLSTPLWVRIEGCKHAAVLSLLKGPVPADRARAIRLEAIRIAGATGNRRAYSSWSERDQVDRSLAKWMRRHGL